MSVKKILIVDDRLEMRKLVEASLRSENHLFIYAVSGLEGWHKIQDERPDLIVLDIMMPGVIDGLTVLRRVRSAPDLKACKVVLLTGKGQQEDLIQGLSAGADAYMVKPFSPRELADLVATLLDE
jgi:two-component system, OmpR family, phosphate regulon response regulator PhoB